MKYITPYVTANTYRLNNRVINELNKYSLNPNPMYQFQTETKY